MAKDIPQILIVEGAVWRDTGYLMVIRSPQEDHAANSLSFLSGTIEGNHAREDVLEETLQREIQEEIGVSVQDIHYVYSSLFINSHTETVVSVVYLCRYQNGTPQALDPTEVSAVLHLTPEQITTHPQTPPWTLAMLKRCEELRHTLGW